MVKHHTSDKVYIGRSNIKNADRGVFAKYAIKKSEIIERCPVIVIPKDNTTALNDSVLITYLFYFGKNKEKSAFALGFGSIYNHSDEPNARFKIKEKERVIEFIAAKEIKKDEEITFNYRGDQKENKNPLWFEE